MSGSSKLRKLLPAATIEVTFNPSLVDDLVDRMRHPDFVGGAPIPPSNSDAGRAYGA